MVEKAGLESIVLPEWVATYVFVPRFSSALRSLEADYITIQELMKRVGNVKKADRLYNPYLLELKESGLVELDGVNMHCRIKLTESGLEFVQHMPAEKYVHLFKATSRQQMGMGQIVTLLDLLSGINKSDELSKVIGAKTPGEIRVWLGALVAKGLVEKPILPKYASEDGYIARNLTDIGRTTAEGLSEPMIYLAKKFGENPNAEGKPILSLNRLRDYTPRRKLGGEEFAEKKPLPVVEESARYVPRKLPKVKATPKKKPTKVESKAKQAKGGNARCHVNSTVPKGKDISALLESLPNEASVDSFEGVRRFVYVKIPDASTRVYCFGEQTRPGYLSWGYQITRKGQGETAEDKADWQFRTTGAEQVLLQKRKSPSSRIVPITEVQYKLLSSCGPEKRKNREGSIRNYQAERAIQYMSG